MKNLPEVNLAYYEKSDWNKFLSIAVDRETLHDSWDDWHESFLRTKNHLKSQGFVVHKITIDLDDLDEFCRSRQIANNGKARSEYVSNPELRKKK